jgi:hypothetical protein
MFIHNTLGKAQGSLPVALQIVHVHVVLPLTYLTGGAWSDLLLVDCDLGPVLYRVHSVKSALFAI